MQSHQAFAIIHSSDGYDEISLTADVKVITQQGEKMYAPQYFDSDYLAPADIYGGQTLEESVGIFKKVISGKGTEAQNAVVIANAAMAIKCISQSDDVNGCIDQAKTILLNGKAEKTLQNLLSLK
jgi:anthranilate phosphoribosyltransferase